MFGAQMARSGHEDSELHFVGPTSAERLARDPEFKRVTRIADIFVFAPVN
jgi:hypothetical protein